jgi:FdhD protein
VSRQEREVLVARLDEREVAFERDLVAEEEPLEIRVQGIPVAVVMRTPGHDEELVAGFLVTERVLESLDEVRALEHCDTVPDPEAEENVMDVKLRAGVFVNIERLRRNLYASSSCGVCGKATLENVLSVAPPLDDDACFSAELLYGMPERLRLAQEVFERTGGLHGVALFDPQGAVVCVREDIGRHNAVDKVVGHAALARRDLRGHALLVSGRVSFEVVQKAAAARIPLVAGISAPSSLAVRLGEAAGVAIVGFLRGRSANVYSAAERVIGTPRSTQEGA